MKKTIIYIFIVLFLSISSIIAQSRQSSLVDVRIKIVKKITIEISEFNNDVYSFSKKSNIPTSSSIPKRDLMIQYGNRLKNNSKFLKNGKEGNDFLIPQIGVANIDKTIIPHIDSGNQFLLKTSLETDNIKLLYSKPTNEQVYNFEPTITVVY
jgi:hypothetical protein